MWNLWQVGEAVDGMGHGLEGSGPGGGYRDRGAGGGYSRIVQNLDPAAGAEGNDKKLPTANGESRLPCIKRCLALPRMHRAALPRTGRMHRYLTLLDVRLANYSRMCW